MGADILIIGQGLAGTLLAWECERAGIAFEIADPGHAVGASLAGAGIINPITGRRLVKSWRVDALLPVARAAYQELEAALGVTIWQELRVRRLFADERERAVFAAKRSHELAAVQRKPSSAPPVEVESPRAQSTQLASLAPYAGAADEAGFWIEGAARVNLPVLLRATRARWTAQGRLREGRVKAAEEGSRYALTVDCTGLHGARDPRFAFVPWEFSKGELIEVAVEGLAPDVVINRRQWVLPVGEGRAWIGATHEPGVTNPHATAAACDRLAASARELLPDQPFRVVGQRAGVRVNLPDKRPVAGRHPENPRLGLLNGLGAKGALLAPGLAREWVRHLTIGAPFDAEIDVRRFAK